MLCYHDDDDDDDDDYYLYIVLVVYVCVFVCPGHISMSEVR